MQKKKPSMKGGGGGGSTDIFLELHNDSMINNENILFIDNLFMIWNA